MAGVSITRDPSHWADYSKFVAFTASRGDKDLVVGTPTSLVKATGDKLWNPWRTEKSKRDNDFVRDAFRTSVLGLFGLTSGEENRLPATVKKAMELGEYGKGKPLSVRRIKTVDAAVMRLISANCGKKLPVDPGFEVEELEDLNGAESNARKVFDNRKNYDAVLERISADVYRGKDFRLPENESNSFVDAPYGMCTAKKAPLYGFMVNGRQLPVPAKEGETADIERFVNLSLAEELTERKPVVRWSLNGEKPGDFIPLNPENPLARDGGIGLIVTGPNAAKVVTRDELELKRTAMYFGGQTSFYLAGRLRTNDSVFRAGEKPVSDMRGDVVCTSNIVRSPDGSGYDIVVRQKMNNVVGLTNAGTSRMRCHFDPMNPGSWSATCTYHVELKGGKPVFSYKEKPEVRASLPKPISQKKFNSQVWKFAQAHKDEIIQAMGDGDAREWWSRFDEGERAEMFNQAVKNTIEAATNESAPVNVLAIASNLYATHLKVLPSKDAVNFELELAQAQADGVFDNENVYRSALGQIGAETYRDGSARLTGEEERSFSKKPGRRCTRTTIGRVRGCMLNGRQIRVPSGPDDKTTVKGAVGQFLLSALPAKRKAIGSNDLRKAGVQVPEAAGGGFVDLRNNPANLMKVAGLIGDRAVAKDLAGLVATGDGGFKAVTAKELALNRVAVSFCQQSSQRMAQRIIQHDARRLGGRLLFDPNDDRTVYTTNVVPADDGYDVIVRQDIKGITGIDRGGKGKVTFDPKKTGGLGTISLQCTYHIGMEGGRPKVTFKESPHGIQEYSKLLPSNPEP